MTMPSLETIKELSASLEAITNDLSKKEHKDLHYHFKANPLQVIKDYGGPVGKLDKKTRVEMHDALSNVDLLGIDMKCIGCEVGLNAILVAAGGAVVLAAAILAGPEVLAGSAIVAAIASFCGVEASVISTIILSVTGGEAVTALEGVIAAICEAMGACG